ncbi:MAG TPA: TlyA family RNA methyltransferase [Actinomycetota bacterium]|nr:TlyA family RNA methyltransferase [Actinomycetota bacterium]
MRRRLDLEMVRRGIVKSRTEAAEAITAGKVVVGGRPAAKASSLVSPSEPIHVTAPVRRFVSRGGEKLDAALDRFAISTAGRRALDVGSSTGGFVDCLLQRRATHVIAVDVGYGQLDWRLREDPRVTVLERTNVRDLRPEELPYLADLLTADLSFISLGLAIGPLRRCSSPHADFVFLVKPQFEAGRRDVGERGVVRDPDVWRRVLEGVEAHCRRQGLSPMDVMPSPLLGPAGNVEFLLHAREGEPLDTGPSRESAVAEATHLVASHA